MQENSDPLRGRLDGDPLDMLRGMAGAEAERMPGRMLLQLERLLTASAEGARVEAERLRARHGKEDPRPEARAREGAAAEALLAVLDRIREAVDPSRQPETMQVRGTLRRAGEGMTVEIAEAEGFGWVAARTVTDARGRFETVLEAPRAEGGAGRLVAVARDEAGTAVARSEPFAFAAGKTANLVLDPISEKPGAPKAGGRRTTAA